MATPNRKILVFAAGAWLGCLAALRVVSARHMRTAPATAANRSASLDVPEHLKEQVKAAMRAAFRLTATEGIARLEKQAQWLEREYPDAAASLREGLAEMFTVSGEGGWTRETDQASQRNSQTSWSPRRPTQPRPGRSEIDTRGWLAYGLAQGSS